MHHYSECKTCNKGGRDSPQKCLLLELGYDLTHWDFVEKSDANGRDTTEFFHVMGTKRWKCMDKFQDICNFLHEFHWHVADLNELTDHLTCCGCQEQWPFSGTLPRNSTIFSHLSSNKCDKVLRGSTVYHAFLKAWGVSNLSDWEVYLPKPPGKRLKVFCNKFNDRVRVGGVLEVVRASVKFLEWQKKLQLHETKNEKQRRLSRHQDKIHVVLPERGPRNKKISIKAAISGQKVTLKRARSFQLFQTISVLKKKDESKNISILPIIPTESLPNIPGVHLFIPTSTFSLPHNYVNHLLLFRQMYAKSTTRINGKRNEVHLEGTKSQPFKNYCAAKEMKEMNAASSFSIVAEFNRFVACFRSTIETFARKQGYRNIQMSPDVVALVGAEKQQTPHVDLLPGQMQVVMALTDNAEATLVYHSATENPTHAEALDMLEMTEQASSRFAEVLKFAPAMALPRAVLQAGMKSVVKATASSFSSSSTLSSSSSSSSFSSSSSSSSSTKWTRGTMLVADHTVVHAGPCQPNTEDAPPRVVLFTTFTCNKNRYSTTSAQVYNVSDQYLPAHFVEDPNMPVKRAIRLLQEWREDQPQLSYNNDRASKACAVLSGTDANLLDASVVKRHLDVLRSESLDKE